MENQIQIFEKEEFGQIRTIELNGQPWFVGRDVCNAFCDKNQSRSLSKIDGEDKKEQEITDNLGRKQTAIIINESGLYSLLFQMQPQKANNDGVSDAYPIEIQERIDKLKAFKRWVTSDVLPSIRKFGGYVTDNALDQLIDNPEAAQKFFNTLKEERAKKGELDGYVKELEPKAHYHDIILQCPDLIPITIIAKDYGYSAIAFNRLLFAFRFQFNQSGTWVLYQPYADKGYTQTQTHHVNGKPRVHTYFTQKGRNFVYHLLKSKGILPLAERKAIKDTEKNAEKNNDIE